jgi:hypothetical protein
VQAVLAAGKKAGHPDDLTRWTEPAMRLAVEEVGRFSTEHKKGGA